MKTCDHFHFTTLGNGNNPCVTPQLGVTKFVQSILVVHGDGDLECTVYKMYALLVSKYEGFCNQPSHFELDPPNPSFMPFFTWSGKRVEGWGMDMGRVGRNSGWGCRTTLLVSFLCPITFALKPYAVLWYDEYIVMIAYDGIAKGHSALENFIKVAKVPYNGM